MVTTSRDTHTKPRSLATIEAHHPPCPVGKLLPNQNGLISKPRPSHSSLVVALLSQLSLYEPVLMESGQPSTKHRAGPLNHVSNKNQFLTRREPLKPTQRATLRIKLHIPLIKLIKKDQVCYSSAPSTTNQNATQRIYIKDIKWLGKSL